MTTAPIELLKERLRLPDVYEALTGRTVKKAGREWSAFCPFHDDADPSFSMSETLWHCFAGCGGGDAFHFIQRCLGCDFKAAVAWAERFLGGHIAPSERKSPPPAPDATVTLDPALADGYHASLTEAARAYYRSRGLADATIDRYRLGWGVPFRSRCAFPRYVIPFFDRQGQLRAFRFRRDDTNPRDTHAKYLGTAGVPTYLFGLDQLPATDWAILCGAQIDAMLLIEMGFPAIAGAGEGSFKAEWVADLTAAGLARLSVLFDADEGGRKGAQRVWEVVRGYGCRDHGGLKIQIVRWPGDVPHKADVAEMVARGWTRDDFANLLRASELGAVRPRSLVQRRGRRSTRVQPLDVPPATLHVVPEDDMATHISAMARADVAAIARRIGKRCRS
jgi:DNA primase